MPLPSALMQNNCGVTEDFPVANHTVLPSLLTRGMLTLVLIVPLLLSLKFASAGIPRVASARKPPAPRWMMPAWVKPSDPLPPASPPPASLPPSLWSPPASPPPLVPSLPVVPPVSRVPAVSPVPPAPPSPSVAPVSSRPPVPGGGIVKLGLQAPPVSSGNVAPRRIAARIANRLRDGLYTVGLLSMHVRGMNAEHADWPLRAAWIAARVAIGLRPGVLIGRCFRLSPVLTSSSAVGVGRARLE